MSWIDPVAKVQAHMDRIVDWRRGQKPAPVTVEWDLSNRCGLGCVDCHFAHTHSRGPWATLERRLPMAFHATGDLADSAVVRRALHEMADAGVKGIVWSGGGDPSLHPDWLDLMDNAAWAGLSQGVYTYGGRITAEMGERLRHRADFVVFSLDAPDAESYAVEKRVSPDAFAQACAGVRATVGGRAVVGASFLIHAANWKRMNRMLALARELGATYTTFRPSIQVGADSTLGPGDTQWLFDADTSLQSWSRERDVILDVDRFRQYRDWTGRSYDACRGIQLSTTVTPDGRMWLCPQRRGFADSCLGDLSKESFSAAWARHPSQWTDFRECRTMCRLHQVNTTMAALASPVPHGAFV